MPATLSAQPLHHEVDERPQLRARLRLRQSHDVQGARGAGDRVGSIESEYGPPGG